MATQTKKAASAAKPVSKKADSKPATKKVVKPAAKPATKQVAKKPTPKAPVKKPVVSKPKPVEVKPDEPVKVLGENSLYPIFEKEEVEPTPFPAPTNDDEAAAMLGRITMRNAIRARVDKRGINNLIPVVDLAKPKAIAGAELTGKQVIPTVPFSAARVITVNKKP